ncbi:MAG TPA: hypothetical protein P5081_04850 [Phycisphaerae bacterium]|nr:hypothetical protein [Phycisphaerae bacterium]HRW52192.1 hypothetical protein [Phycisphaerae bacterium]
MEAKKANTQVLYNLLYGLEMMPDLGTPFDACTDVNDPTTYVDAIRQYILPEFERLNLENQNTVRGNLQFFLTTRLAPFAELVELCRMEASMPSPDDPAQLFVWIWQALFPSEDYRLADTAGWTVVDDRIEAARVFLAGQKDDGGDHLPPGD